MGIEKGYDFPDKTVDEPTSSNSTPKASLVNENDSFKHKKVNTHQLCNGTGMSNIFSSFDDELNGIIDRLTNLKTKFNTEVGRSISHLSEANDNIVKRLNVLECRVLCFIICQLIMILLTAYSVWHKELSLYLFTQK